MVAKITAKDLLQDEIPEMTVAEFQAFLARGEAETEAAELILKPDSKSEKLMRRLAQQARRAQRQRVIMAYVLGLISPFFCMIAYVLMMLWR